MSSKAANQRIPNGDRLSIVSFGVSQATTRTRGSSPLIGIVVALVVLLLGCVSILWILALTRGWRSASKRERVGFGELLETNGLSFGEPLEPDGLSFGEPLEPDGLSQRHVPTNGVPDLVPDELVELLSGTFTTVARPRRPTTQPCRPTIPPGRTRLVGVSRRRVGGRPRAPRRVDG